jgi:hypothetical protein
LTDIARILARAAPLVDADRVRLRTYVSADW